MNFGASWLPNGRGTGCGWHCAGEPHANIPTCFVLGVRPLEPGYRKILIAPQPGSLERLRSMVPTVREPLTITLQNQSFL